MALTLLDVLREERDQIIAGFVVEVRQRGLAPVGLSSAALADHLPQFLDSIVRELAGPGDPNRESTAREHGVQRWAHGYDLSALVRDYGVLRQVILQWVKARGAKLDHGDFDALGRCLDQGVADATTAYVAYRDQELNEHKAKLEFLAEAGQLLSSTLDLRSTISNLMGLLVPRVADWCAVHLDDTPPEDMAVVHVDPAKAELVREIYRRFPLPEDSPYGYAHVARTGEPQLMPEVDPQLFARAARSTEHLELLRRLSAKSWLIVPLRVGRSIFGALTLVFSDSGRKYSGDDLVMANELARRAAVAIDNARLYELSQSARSRVEAATRAKDEFVAGVSHELRTPLNAILGWTRLARSGSLPAEKREHALEVVERNAVAQSRLVSDLLDISRAITGKIRLNPGQVNLVDVVDMALEGIRPAASSKALRIDTALTTEEALLRADGDRLQQVVWNLLSNAVKFTPKHGSISVTLKKSGSDYELTVSDSGEGIRPDFLPHVFETFRQADGTSTRPHGGLGIGLSIAKHIVELHGGSISAHSAGIGAGATFTVQLPVSPLVSTTVGVPRMLAAMPLASPPTKVTGLEDVRVLVVDDDVDGRELIAYVLEAAGLSVRTAGSVDEALSQLGTEPADVLISDIGMPGEDGYQLIRRIRTMAAATKDIAAIALTAFARNEDRTRALVEGFNAHLTKPVEASELIATVSALTLLAPRSKSQPAPSA